MIGRRLEEAGVGRLAGPDEVEAVIRGTLVLLRDQSITACARQFRDKYAEHDSDRVVAEIVAQMELTQR